MMLLGFGDPNIDPTSMYTDAVGVTCRQYQTMTAPDGSTICNQCMMDGPTDENGVPISCVGQNTITPSGVPQSTLVNAPIVALPSGASVVQIPAPMMPVTTQMRWPWGKIALALASIGAIAGGVALYRTRRRAA